ncbi:MAG: hypothetical protein QOI74_3731 [Micromonosporaceae bacterium]|nr:hypothetical protein [Micromonosporaceae bacterium]
MSAAIDTGGDRLTRRGPAVLALALVLCLTGCSFFGGKKSDGKKVSVFSVQPGQCFQAPGTVKAQLSSLTKVACNSPHNEESYAVVQYQSANPSVSATGAAVNSAYPGDDVLTTFAQGACAQRFTDYVGVNYLDSKLYFTYLLPSARSWEQDADRNVTCFVTTTGNQLTATVKGSKQ